MTVSFIAVLTSPRASIHSRFELAAEILALRHQLAVLQRTTPKRPRLRPIDRLLWLLPSRVWSNWRQAVQIVTPATVILVNEPERPGHAQFHRCHPKPADERQRAAIRAVQALDRHLSRWKNGRSLISRRWPRHR